jgi:putative transcriptional regulator
MALSNAIRLMRFNQGEMTQKELAEIVGVSRQTINAIEGNKYSPSLVVAFKIDHAFGPSVDDVFFYELEESDSLDPSHVIIDVEY